ncbi:penicillin-binding protein 1C [Algihabitans albus]|uniref:penicillin-binding protein 1C n=1 Tax=Algihabitans albus TaxID=2164067 RepID=UPI001ABCAB09|nr:penicillin-binding protein 1C [Algihabitans albus]
MRWRRISALAATALLLFAGGLVALRGLDRAFPPNLDKAAVTSVAVWAADGELLRVFATPDEKIRLAALPEAVDPLFLDLLVAVEDKRFWRHGGVDTLAVLRASWQALRHGRIVSGASTLTMQVARLLEPRPRTLKAKAIEAFRAWQLERRFSKREILGLYMTLAPYGGRIEGLQAASLAWFGKPPQRLRPQEAALLVALPQAPERLRPDRFPEAAAAARAKVLARGRDRGLLGVLPLEVPVPSRLRAWPLLAPHLGRRLAGEGTTATTLDAGLQGRAEALTRQAAEALHPRAGAAVLVVERRSRAVRAYVGSPDFLAAARQGQVDMVAARRSPGSTLKPLIYGLAFDQRLAHPETLVLDAPTGFGPYRPRNFDGVFHGELSLRQALQLSLNIPAVKLMQRVGPGVFVSRLAAQGIDLAYAGGGWPGLAIALGGGALSLEQLTRLYAALADDGVARPLEVVRGAAEQGDAAPTPLFDPAARAQVADILLGAPRPPSALGRFGIAFKTGTSYGFRDAWAVGFDARHVVGVWLGRPDGTPLPEASGFRAAAPLLFRIFDLLPDAPLAPLGPEPPPPGLAKLDVRVTSVAEPAPEIVFPVSGSRLRLGDLPPALTLEASGGKRPLTWLVDGRPVASDSLGRRALWRPRGAGFAEIVVVDAAGRRDAVRLRLTDGTARTDGLPRGRLISRERTGAR